MWADSEVPPSFGLRKDWTLGLHGVRVGGPRGGSVSVALSIRTRLWLGLESTMGWRSTLYFELLNLYSSNSHCCSILQLESSRILGALRSRKGQPLTPKATKHGIQTPTQVAPESYICLIRDGELPGLASGRETIHAMQHLRAKVITCFIPRSDVHCEPSALSLTLVISCGLRGLRAASRVMKRPL